MTGISRHTGARIAPDAHLAQSVGVILSTPLGSRVMRRSFGSRLPDLIDTPVSGETVIEFVAATAEALDAWEPRLRLRRVQIDGSVPSTLTLELEAEADGTLQTIPVEVRA